MPNLNNPGPFVCAYCGTKNPPYDFVLNQGGSPQMRVQFVTVVCGGTHSARTGQDELGHDVWSDIPCRRILSVCLLACEISRVPMVGG